MSLTKDFLTPTYQSNLNSAVRDVVQNLNNGQTWAAWESLKSLFHLSPPKVKEECRTRFDEIRRELARRAAYKELDWTMQQQKRQKSVFQFLYRENWLFFDLIIEKLFEKGYLQVSLRPFNPNPKHIKIDMVQS